MSQQMMYMHNMIEMLQEQNRTLHAEKGNLKMAHQNKDISRARAENGNAPQGCYGTVAAKDQSALDVHAAAAHHGHALGPERYCVVAVVS